MERLKIDPEYNLVIAVETSLQKQVALDEKTEVEDQVSCGHLAKNLCIYIDPAVLSFEVFTLKVVAFIL